MGVGVGHAVPHSEYRGTRRHSHAVAHIAAWFVQRRSDLKLETFLAQDVQVPTRIQRTVDVVVTGMPCPDEEVFTTPPYLCVDVMSTENTLADLQQQRLDEFLGLGVPNVWVVDPWKKRGWTVSNSGWHIAADGILRTSDQRVAMPLADVLMA